MTAALRWTEQGRTALERARTWGIPLCNDATTGALETRVAARIARLAPAWQRGLEKSDSVGKRGVEIATRGAPDTADVDAWASTLSLVGAYEPEDLAPVAELLLRRHGLTFALRVLVAMWSLVTSYHNPDWPKDDAHLAVWLRALGPPNENDAYDASVSYAKARFADYLAKTHRCVGDLERAEMTRAVDAIWSDAPVHARPALVAATRDGARAEDLAHALLADERRAYRSRYPEGALCPLFSDPELMVAWSGASFPLTLGMLERLGEDALSLYERRLGGRETKHAQLRLLEQLASVAHPRAARLLALRAERAPFTKLVRAYFAAEPAMLDAVLADHTLEEHRPVLAKLSHHVRPAPKKPRKK